MKTKATVKKAVKAPTTKVNKYAASIERWTRRVASRKAGLARAIAANNTAVAKRLTASVARAEGRLARIKGRAARNGQKKAA